MNKIPSYEKKPPSEWTEKDHARSDKDRQASMKKGAQEDFRHGRLTVEQKIAHTRKLQNELAEHSKKVAEERAIKRSENIGKAPEKKDKESKSKKITVFHGPATSIKQKKKK